jgi:hypothetical protein
MSLLTCAESRVARVGLPRALDTINTTMPSEVLKHAHPDQHERNLQAVKTAGTEMFHRVQEGE